MVKCQMLKCNCQMSKSNVNCQLSNVEVKCQRSKVKCQRKGVFDDRNDGCFGGVRDYYRRYRQYFYIHGSATKGNIGRTRIHQPNKLCDGIYVAHY